MIQVIFYNLTQFWTQRKTIYFSELPVLVLSLFYNENESFNRKQFSQIATMVRVVILKQRKQCIIFNSSMDISFRSKAKKRIDSQYVKLYLAFLCISPPPGATLPDTTTHTATQAIHIFQGKKKPYYLEGWRIFTFIIDSCLINCANGVKTCGCVQQWVERMGGSFGFCVPQDQG